MKNIKKRIGKLERDIKEQQEEDFISEEVNFEIINEVMKYYLPEHPWCNFTPKERQRIYSKWKQLSPEEKEKIDEISDPELRLFREVKGMQIELMYKLLCELREMEKKGVYELPSDISKILQLLETG